MTFGQLQGFDRFTIEGEPESMFYKECNRYDGAVNAYRTKCKYKNDCLEPVIFSKSYEVQKISSEYFNF